MCEPGTQMVLNVSSETQGISLQPSLRSSNVLGIRVEVNGQVLSQGGDVGADQIADTSAAKPDRWAVASSLVARSEQGVRYDCAFQAAQTTPQLPRPTCDGLFSASWGAAVPHQVEHFSSTTLISGRACFSLATCWLPWRCPAGSSISAYCQTSPQLHHRTTLRMHCLVPLGQWSIALFMCTSLPCCRQNTDFLPAAVILGLEPGVPVNIPIVVTAEDGVTSLRYYVSLVQSPGAQQCNLGTGVMLSPGAQQCKLVIGMMFPGDTSWVDKPGLCGVDGCKQLLHTGY